jgi:hypothetical protein
MEILFQWVIPILMGIVLAIIVDKFWKIIILVAIIYGYHFAEYEFVTKPKVVYFTEYAYSEGQIDYMNNDIRIGQKSDSSYYWIKSPWDDSKRQPIYDFKLVD